MSSLLPYIVSELLDELHNPQATLYDQNFGVTLHPSLELNSPRIMRMPLNSGYLRPWRHINFGNSGISNVDESRTDFKVNLDVQQFKPEEINVKLQDSFLVVEAKHDEREDKHGFVSRHFVRRYKLPDDVDLDKIKSHLSSDGVLTLVGPKKIQTSVGDRTIPIERTNQPAMKQQDSKSRGNGEGENQEETEKEQQTIKLGTII